MLFVLLLSSLVLPNTALKLNFEAQLHDGAQELTQNFDARAALSSALAMMWLVGIVLNGIANFSDSFGMVLRKHALNVGEGDKVWYYRYRWLLGFVLSIAVSGVLEGIAMSMAPLSLISPLSGLSAAFTALISTLWLGEKLSSRGVLAICVIVFGTSLTSTFGSHSEGSHTTEELIGFLGDSKVRMFIVATLAAWICSAVAVQAIEKGRSAMLMNHSQLIFANFAALLGGWSSVLLKCSTNIIASGIESNTEILAFALCVVLTAMTGVAQLTILNQGMEKHEAVTYCSQYKALMTVYAVTCGSIFFQELKEFTTFQFVAFPCAVLVVCVGILLFPKSAADETTPKAKTMSGQKLEVSS